VDLFRHRYMRIPEGSYKINDALGGYPGSTFTRNHEGCQLRFPFPTSGCFVGVYLVDGNGPSWKRGDDRARGRLVVDLRHLIAPETSTVPIEWILGPLGGLESGNPLRGNFILKVLGIPACWACFARRSGRLRQVLDTMSALSYVYRRVKALGAMRPFGSSCVTCMPRACSRGTMFCDTALC